MEYYAHSNEQEQAHWQSIKAHLENTANLAHKAGIDAGVSEFAYIAALLHDIGKYSQAFQKRLSGANPKKVDHATAGAQEAGSLFNNKNKIMATLLSYCIAGHHGGLPDYGSVIDVSTDGTLCARLKKPVEDYSAYNQDIVASNLKLPSQVPIKPIRDYPWFSLSFFTRIVYSALVDADFLETESFMNNGQKARGDYASIAELCRKLNQFLAGFGQSDLMINQRRTAILQTCLDKAGHKPGFFTLTVPTGGGKTLSSMAFALNHAVKNDLKRIIYVIPYTSIIEQNAAEFKKHLGEENVLEHHSNFDWEFKRQAQDSTADDDQTNNTFEKLKLAAENWDVPIVVTTNVQFFESLFANRSSRCRKLHNLAKSVIIFDEAQMLPRDYIKPCLYAVYELVKNYGATAVFCTATQPSIERFFPKGTQVEELIEEPRELYNFFKRVQVKNIGKQKDAQLIQQMNDHLQALCIVNTRKHAKGLFEGLTGDGKFHLSTLMCPAHRKEVIAAIRERLKQDLPCRVVSTQIMEAGIDVDFPVGYRAIAGLDSIIQAAGRVNRENKRPHADSYLYVFEPDSELVKRTPVYIQQGADVAKTILRKEDPLCLEAIDSYFNLLYDLQGDRAFDVQNILGCFEKGIRDELNFDFKTAAEKFQLIENNTLSVVIPYNERAVSLLQQAGASRFPRSLSRQLQIYTVNIYEHEFRALQNLGIIDSCADTYHVLKDRQRYYNDQTGLQISQSSGGEAIFF